MGFWRLMKPAASSVKDQKRIEEAPARKEGEAARGTNFSNALRETLPEAEPVNKERKRK